MPADVRRVRGTCGEQIAALFLEARGYEIVARNVRAGRREIDLIASRGNTLVAVEVKWRRRDSPAGAGSEAWRSEQRARAAEAVLLRMSEFSSRPEQSWRFDLIVLEEEPNGLRLVHRRAAWSPANSWW